MLRIINSRVVSVSDVSRVDFGSPALLRAFKAINQVLIWFLET
jgi:hypothetical protein